MKNLAMFAGRVSVGLLVAGHGAQKLFGWFDGPGLAGWTSAAEHMNMKPPRLWAILGGTGEFGGGLLTALGFLNPIGPIMMGAMMIAAAYKGHWGKPIWASKGGAELSVSFLASAVVTASHGPGRLSLDHALGIRVPRWITALAVVASAGLLAETIRPTVTTRLLNGATPPDSGATGE